MCHAAVRDRWPPRQQIPAKKICRFGPQGQLGSLRLYRPNQKQQYSTRTIFSVVLIGPVIAQHTRARAARDRRWRPPAAARDGLGRRPRRIVRRPRLVRISNRWYTSFWSWRGTPSDASGCFRGRRCDSARGKSDPLVRRWRRESRGTSRRCTRCVKQRWRANVWRGWRDASVGETKPERLGSNLEKEARATMWKIKTETLKLPFRLSVFRLHPDDRGVTRLNPVKGGSVQIVRTEPPNVEQTPNVETRHAETWNAETANVETANVTPTDTKTETISPVWKHNRTAGTHRRPLRRPNQTTTTTRTNALRRSLRKSRGFEDALRGYQE